MKKDLLCRMLACTLALIMISGLTACGSTDDADGSSQGGYSFGEDGGNSDNDSDSKSEEPKNTDAPAPEIRTGGATTLSEGKNKELLDGLHNSIDAILNSETTLYHSDVFIPGETYTGTAYYVSNNGDDGNDGLTPETAWRTDGWVAKESGSWGEGSESILKPGDVVFFERGGVFRQINEMVLATDGVTYSAYGEGPKPVLTFSPESGVGAEKWQLIYEGESGEKIWEFYRPLPDTSFVVLNDGEIIALRVYEFFGSAGYISCDCESYLMHSDKGVILKDRLLSPAESLTEDFTIISRPKIEGYDITEVEELHWKPNATGYSIMTSGEGPLYLRCDAGNPGEIFDSVEFSVSNMLGNIWLKASDVVIDNLNICCGGTACIKNGFKVDGEDWRKVCNTVIQNCEFAYSGGSVTSYSVSDSGECFVVVQGDGLYSIINNSITRNNYMHDCLGATATFEGDLADETPTHSYYHVLDNVFLNTFGIHLDSASECLKYLDSVIIRGNQIWNSGKLTRGGYYYTEGAIGITPNFYGELLIEDNVIYCTRCNPERPNSILRMDWHTDVWEAGYTAPKLSNNIYVQYEGGEFAEFLMQSELWTISDADLIDKAAQLLEDTTSEFYFIPTENK